MEGWISLHRKFINWEWFNDSNMVKLFIYLLLKANHETNGWRGIEIKRGQILTGLDSLHKETNISIQTLRTCLKRLENTGEINMQTNNQYRIITICKYDSYQINQQATNKQTNKQLTSNQQATNKQLTTNNNDNNVNNDNNINKYIPNFQEFKNYALENCPSLDIEDLKLKYKAWEVAGWKDGKNKSIKNWKQKILQTIPYLKKTESKQLINDTWKNR